MQLTNAMGLERLLVEPEAWHRGFSTGLAALLGFLQVRGCKFKGQLLRWGLACNHKLEAISICTVGAFLKNFSWEIPYLILSIRLCVNFCSGFIDVALDTAPYAGTTTTCEARKFGTFAEVASSLMFLFSKALYMGVPVVTLKGRGIHVKSLVCLSCPLARLKTRHFCQAFLTAASRSSPRRRMWALRCWMPCSWVTWWRKPRRNLWSRWGARWVQTVRWGMAQTLIKPFVLVWEKRQYSMTWSHTHYHDEPWFPLHGLSIHQPLSHLQTKPSTYQNCHLGVPARVKVHPSFEGM